MHDFLETDFKILLRITQAIHAPTLVPTLLHGDCYIFPSNCIIKTFCQNDGYIWMFFRSKFQANQHNRPGRACCHDEEVTGSWCAGTMQRKGWVLKELTQYDLISLERDYTDAFYPQTRATTTGLDFSLSLPILLASSSCKSGQLISSLSPRLVFYLYCP